MSQQLARARDWVLAQEPHQNPRKLGEAAARSWCLPLERASLFADLYTTREEKRVAAEREQLDRAREVHAAWWAKVHDVEKGLADQRRELTHRENTLRQELQNIDTEEEQQGPLGRRLAARQRAAKRNASEKSYTRSKPNANPSTMPQAWPANGVTPKPSGENSLPPGSGNYRRPDTDTAHSEAVRRWGFGVDAAEAVGPVGIGRAGMGPEQSNPTMVAGVT